MRKTPMFLTATLGMAAAMASMPADAATAPPSAAVTIAATGEGAWYIRCDLNKGSDLVELSTARPSYAANHLRSASCRYQANRTPLTITVSAPGWACPFHGAEGQCQFVVRRFGDGEFRLAQPR
jgi:invasion protein IalB